jgi:hypothetical protein
MVCAHCIVYHTLVWMRQTAAGSAQHQPTSAVERGNGDEATGNDKCLYVASQYMLWWPLVVYYRDRGAHCRLTQLFSMFFHRQYRVVGLLYNSLCIYHPISATIFNYITHIELVKRHVTYMYYCTTAV